jgi:uncharacterized integral membrane protein
MLEVIFSPPFAAGFAKIMTITLAVLLLILAIQGVRNRVRSQKDV